MIPPLCFITDAEAPRTITEQALAAASGGAGWVQLRHKTMPDAEFADLARMLNELLRAEGATLIVNDRIEIAASIGAGGLHVGQGDGDIAQIRQRIGPDMILGLSVETLAHIRAVPDGVDYLGLGPVYATPSKPDHAKPIGHEGFADLVSWTDLPCLAIGGIKLADVARVKRAGGAGVAVVSAISRAEDMAGAARALRTAWEET